MQFCATVNPGTARAREDIQDLDGYNDFNSGAVRPKPAVRSTQFFPAPSLLALISDEALTAPLNNVTVTGREGHPNMVTWLTPSGR